MKRAILGVLFVFFLSNLLPGRDLETLVQEYNKAKAQAGRGGRGGGGGGWGGWGRGGGGGTATAEGILDEISQLGTDASIKFLLDELERAPESLVTLVARAALKSLHPLAPNLVFRLLGRKSTKVSIAILDAVDPQENPGRMPWQGQQRRTGVDVDWKKVEVDLLMATWAVKDVEVKQRLIPVVARLHGVAAAKAIVQVSASQSNPRPGEDEVHSLAVQALVKAGEVTEVKEWIENEAFGVAKSNPGMQAVVAESAGRLKIAALRPQMEKLLSNRSDRVLVAAIEGLSSLPGNFSKKNIKELERQLNRKRSNAARAKILDSLAQDGSAEAFEVVLDSARKGDVATRSIAMGSLAYAASRDDVVEALLSALGDKAIEVRSNALRALRNAKVKAVIPGLIDYLEKETVDRLKADALRLLVDFTGYNMGFVAADWRKWWNGAEKDFSFSGKETKSLTRVGANSYFGIEVVSKRLAFLVDVSRSMEWTGGGGWGRNPGNPGNPGNQGGKTKLVRLKEELTRLLRKMPDDTMVNIITFDGEVRNWSEQLQPLARGGRERAIAFVNGLRTGLHTNVYDSLERGLKDRRVDTLYLLTDGQPTTGRYTDTPGILRGVQELNRVRGISIHCIAFGEESDLLKLLAGQNGGVYRFIEP